MINYLIIDIESYLYKSLSHCEKLIQDKTNPKIFYQGYDISLAEKYIDDNIDRLCNTLNTKQFELVVGDVKYFRKILFPQYKANRKPKPEIYQYVFNLIRDKYGFASLPYLEGDDTCRIIFEDKNYKPEYQKVIVSIDKDFYSVPCNFFRDLNNNDIIEKVGENDAEQHLYYQVLVGDAADNYKGIPNFGDKKYQELIDSKGGCLSSQDVINLFHDYGLTDEDVNYNLRCATIVNQIEYNKILKEMKEVDKWK